MTEIKYDVNTKITVVIEENKKKFTHILRQPTVDDLHIVDINTLGTTIQRADEIIPGLGDNDGDIELYDKIIHSIDGYSFSKSKDWKKKVPAIDKVRVSKLMVKIRVLEEDEVETWFPGKLKETGDDSTVVYLKAWQGVNTMLCTITLQKPDHDNLKEFNRIKSLGTIKRKKNKAVIKDKPTVKATVELFNDMFLEAEGYSDNTLSMIPPHHKTGAINEVFSWLNEDIESTRKN